MSKPAFIKLMQNAVSLYIRHRPVVIALVKFVEVLRRIARDGYITDSEWDRASAAGRAAYVAHYGKKAGAVMRPVEVPTTPWQNLTNEVMHLDSRDEIIATMAEAARRGGWK